MVLFGESVILILTNRRGLRLGKKMEAAYYFSIDVWNIIESEGVKCLSARVVVAGYRNHNDGTLNNAGSNGNYWSSTVNDSNARNLNFNSGNANMNSNNRANGFSLRCLKD